MNILIIKTSSLGDVVHTLPALTDAKKAIPNINFDWVVEEDFAEIPKWHKSVDNIIPIAWRRWRKNIARAIFSGEIFVFLKNLRQKKYDLIIDAQGLIKSAAIANLARGSCCGYDKNSIREKYASLLYKQKFHVSKDQHAIIRIRKLFAAALRYDEPNVPPDYGINKEVFPHSKSEEKYLIFFHGTSRDDKCWHEHKWKNLAYFAIENNYLVYLPWGNNLEFSRSKRIAKDNKKIKVLPKLSLSTIATLLLGSKGVVTIDTGLGHVSAALGIPTLSLYGPTDPKLIGTFGTNTIHLNNFTQLEAADVWKVIHKMHSHFS